MTVSTEVDHNDYTGNGVTTSFPYTFRIFQKSDLVVQVADLDDNIRTLALDTDYTVTGAGGYSGGSVVLTSPLANGWQISISRELPVTQETDLRNQGKFFAEVHEDAFDKLTMLIQQCFGFLRLALRKPSFIANYYDALNNRISNLADPKADKDAVNRRSMYSYVEKMIAGVVGGYGWFIQWGTGAQYRTFNDKMRERLSVIDFGADPTGVKDSTVAFRNAIAAAIENGYKSVFVPSGKYLVSDTLNLGGEDYDGSDGVDLIGENWINTVIYFAPPDANSALIEIIGGSGMPSARRIADLTIQPVLESRYTGVGIRIVGANFVKSHTCWIRQFGIGLHLLNDISGRFTEQNQFSNIRFHRNLIDVLFEANGGDDSFHANDFHNCHFQVKTTVAGDDGNTTPGVAIELRGVTRPAYWYNSYFDVHMFGGAGATAIKLTRANSDNIKGNIVAEGSLILQSTDSASSFESKGGFYSIGAVTFNTVSEPTARLSTFVFENRQSNVSNFVSPRLTGLTPRQIPVYAADRTDNGCAPFIFRIVGPSSDGLAYGASGAPGSDHTFGYVPVGGNLQSFVPGLKLSGDGSSFSSYASTLYISNASTGIQLTPTFIGPRTDNNIDVGSAAFRPKQYWGVNSTIATCDATHKTQPRLIYNAEADAFYEILMLPWVWQWLFRYQSEGDGARLHSGPTVQAAIEIMEKHGLDWTNYSAFCYNKWDAQEEKVESWDDYYVTVKATRALYDESGNCVQEAVPEHKVLVVAAGSRVVQEAREAGEVYSFRKEELLLWMLRALSEKQVSLDTRLKDVEEKISTVMNS